MGAHLTFGKMKKSRMLLCAVTIYACNYALSYAALWRFKEERMFITYTTGCVRKTRDMPELRFAWTQNKITKPVFEFIYWPVNAMIESRSKWK